MKIRKLLSLIKDTFQPSLPVSKIYKYKLAICRDYAKLTASLLLNLFHKNNIYLITIRGHVATVIEINGKLYVLDQRMPISDPNTWLMRQRKDKADLWEIKREGGKIETRFFKTIKIDKKLKLNRKILEEIIPTIEKAMNENRNSVEHVFKGYSDLYDIDDPIIRESLERTIWNKIKNEFLSNSSKIEGLELKSDGKDLILKIYFKA
ncbi:MAG: transglutaminase-like domain-containing protein [Archaeoglobaceae archaeon]